MEKLSSATNETIQMAEKAFGVDEVYPLHPNLVLSTDDTTLFVFEGKARDMEEEDMWKWKMIDATNTDSSVRSDFEVGEDGENTGGLRLRLTFTFTAGGLSAPLYVSVSGLTDEELSPELCPDGVLATKVPGLCRGGMILTTKASGC